MCCILNTHYPCGKQRSNASDWQYFLRAFKCWKWPCREHVMLRIRQNNFSITLRITQIPTNLWDFELNALCNVYASFFLIVQDFNLYFIQTTKRERYIRILAQQLETWRRHVYICALYSCRLKRLECIGFFLIFFIKNERIFFQIWNRILVLNFNTKFNC